MVAALGLLREDSVVWSRRMLGEPLLPTAFTEAVMAEMTCDVEVIAAPVSGRVGMSVVGRYC